MSWYLGVLKKYAVFQGRARRKEYWMYVLFNIIIAFVLSFIDGIIGTSPMIYSLYCLAVVIPSIAVGVRRLHDIGKSGWWWLICLVPIIGSILLLIWMCLDGKPGENQYGLNPKELEMM